MDDKCGGLREGDACDDKQAEAPMWRAHDIALLENTKGADGRRLKVTPVCAPRPRYWNGDPESFAASYLNAYVADGAVVIPGPTD